MAGDLFQRFADEIGTLDRPAPRVLELASGPGFLAERLLQAHPAMALTLLDFSAPMHAMARDRLGERAAGVRFLHRDLKAADWTAGLDRYDAIVTHQAVHELRHKRYAPGLHAQARSLLAPGGAYLVCDHFAGAGGMSERRLYMTVDEQRDALLAAGFADVRLLLCDGGLALYRASE